MCEWLHLREISSQIASMLSYTLSIEPVVPVPSIQHPFTSRMRQRQPMKTALSHPQLFGSNSTNQRRLASAPDPVSGWGQPIRETPAHLMHCGLLAGSRQSRPGADPHTGAVDPGHYSDCRPIRCIVSLSDTCGLADFECLHFVLCVYVCVYACVCASACKCVNLRNSATPFPQCLAVLSAGLSHSVPGFILFLRLNNGRCVALLGAEGLGNKKRLKIKKTCLWTNKDD